MKLILDVSNLLYISYFTTGQLEYEGHPTGILFGFLNKLKKIVKETSPESILFCWDSRKSFRKVIFPEYKAKRHQEKTPEELEDLSQAFKQFNEIREKVLPTLGFNNSFRMTGYEADDLIATICMRKPEDYIIVSSDQDLYQLVTKTYHYEIKMYHPSTGKIMDANAFHLVYGIQPEQWAMAKAIGGCDSDGVPGIEGVADPAKSNNSGAIRYLKGTLDHGKIYDKIISVEGLKLINRNYRLVSLPFEGDIDLEYKEDNLTYSGFKKIFSHYGFESMRAQSWGDLLPIKWDGGSDE
jgi:DNA polymerase-1